MGKKTLKMSSTNYEAVGTIHLINEPVKYSEKFTKQEFILAVQDGKYEQFIKFQLLNERCDLIHNKKQGDEIKVSFNLAGRPYERNGETQYFTNLTAWKIQPVNGAQQPEQSAKNGYPDFPTRDRLNPVPKPDTHGINGDLPF